MAGEAVFLCFERKVWKDKLEYIEGLQLNFYIVTFFYGFIIDKQDFRVSLVT